MDKVSSEFKVYCSRNRKGNERKGCRAPLSSEIVTKSKWIVMDEFVACKKIINAETEANVCDLSEYRLPTVM